VNGQGRAGATTQLPATPPLRGKGRAGEKIRAVVVGVRAATVPPRRRTAVVLLGADAGPTPSKQLAALAEAHEIDGSGRTAALSAVLLATSATLPAVAAMAMVPLASGTGSTAVPPAPCASCTR